MCVVAHSDGEINRSELWVKHSWPLRAVESTEPFVPLKTNAPNRFPNYGVLLDRHRIGIPTVRAGKPFTLVLEITVSYGAAMWAGDPYLGTVGGYFLLFRWSCHFHSLFARIQLSSRFFTNDYFNSFFLHKISFAFGCFEFVVPSLDKSLTLKR
jgi:hypothetical protein